MTASRHARTGRGDIPDPTARAVEDIARGSYGRLVAYLAAGSGDIAAAEDALSDAFVAALRTWPERGVPDRPDSWIVTAARRTLIDAARRRSVAQRRLPDLARLLADDATAPATGTVPGVVAGQGIPDKRLELMFACTHPSIDPVMRAPLMLQAVLGVDAARIAGAFLVPAATMGQRLVRAKAKIKAAGVPFTVPPDEVLAERVSAVLDAVYAAYGTGWDDADGEPVSGGEHPGLMHEAIRLSRLITDLLPDDAEAHGLLALLLHSHARQGARRTPDGDFVPLDRQDVARWDAAEIADAERHLAVAVRLNRPEPRLGPYQLQAAIQSVHNRRAVTGGTDWAAIAALYDGLVALTPTVGACVARAKAVSHTRGPDAATGLLEQLPAELVQRYQPYWVVLAHCRQLRGDPAGAAAAAAAAVALAGDDAVRRHLRAQYPAAPGDSGHLGNP